MTAEIHRSDANPVLATAIRGDVAENLHRGAIAIAGPDGVLIESWGDVERPILPRSSYKILQALPLVESGAADRVGLSEADLALACSSHDGGAIHTERAAAILERIGLDERALRCGTQRPADREARAAMRASGAEPTQLHNNCSGKHSGFLCLARDQDADVEGYIKVDHPVQKAAVAAISEMAGRDASVAYGLDGCSAPNFALTLRSLATAMARLATPDALGGVRAEAARRLTAAMAAHPLLVAGEGRACTDFIEASHAAADGSPAICKTGADGVFTAILPGRGVGIALKIDDGATAAAEAVMAGLLARLGAAPLSDPRIGERASKPILNRRKITVARLNFADLDRI